MVERIDENEVPHAEATEADIRDAQAAAVGYTDGTPEGWVPEFWHNPFIRPLGPPRSGDEILSQLEVRPDHANHERGLSHALRRSCLLRLFEIIVPLERHVQLAERIGMIIRQGYKARDPGKNLHRAAFLASAAAIEGLNEGGTVAEAAELMPVVKHSQAVGFVLLGDPGMSKTTTTNRALAGFAQIVEPDTPYYVKQIVWLKVECPSQGGRRQWCIAILVAIDRVLGTRYAQRFGAERKRVAGDEMMLYVQHLVNLHAIGLIVVDEIQCAMQSPEGVRPLMNFLVGLVNTFGVPLMLIGTNEARPIVDGAFREARRAAGLGQPNWFRMERGEEWDDWLAEIWPYQWTQVTTPLTPAISEAIFDETQGVIDLAVKLVILAQMRAIDRNELEGLPEIIDEGLIRRVAADEFRILATMIKAMRDGRDEILATYSDLQPFHDHVDRLLCQSTGRTMKELRTLRDLRQRVAEARTAARDAPWLPIKASLLQRGHAEEVVDRVIAEALTVNAVDDVIGMIETVNELLTREPAPQPAKARPASKGPKVEAAEGSLRHTVAGSDDPLGALKSSGDVTSVEDLIG